MPLTLPAGLLPAPLLFQPNEIPNGSRLTRYRFDLLTNDEVLLGTLDTVTGGSVEWTSGTAIKAGGSITVTDTAIDWLNVRIRPTAILSGAGSVAGMEVPCGVFLPMAPTEEWDAGGRGWSVELLDKTGILDQDIVTDPDSGRPITYAAPAGANVVDLVRALINDAGEATPALEPRDKSLPAALVWELGTTRLQIINDLLAAADFFSLWTDGMGQYRVTPFVPADQRAPVYSTTTPFSKGDFSLMSPVWKRDRDIYAIPNRYVAVSQGDGEEEGLIAIATNVDPTSPFSYPSRGRWITRVVTGVEAISQEDLNSRAEKGLAGATGVASAFEVEHLFLPDLRLNSAVRFVNADAGLDMLCTVTKTSVPFDPTALCKTELLEAL